MKAKASAIGMAALEILSAGIIKGGGSLLAKVPGLNRVLAPSGKFVRLFVTRATLGTVVQAVIEVGQDAITPALIEALTEYAPHIDWKEQFGETISDPVTFLAGLPFVLMGTGVPRFGRAAM